MSTAAPCWSAKETGRWRLRGAWLAIVCLLCPFFLMGHAADSAARTNQTNQQEARTALAATIQALGGQARLDVRNSRCRVRIASFFQGEPTGTVAEATTTTVFPDKERIDTEKGHVVQIVSGQHGWEITYKGVKELSPEKLDDILRWREHSLAVVLRQWYRDPATLLIDRGPSQVERHETKRITLMRSAGNGIANDAVTLDVDAESHLPLRLSFTWRDPHFHDKNLDAVEYDNYHQIDGIMTPMTVTETHNGEVVRESYILRAQYNGAISKDFFNPQQTAEHLK